MLMPRMLFMKKVVVWLTLTVAVAGCQSTGPKNGQGDHMAGLRCWHFRDQKPLTEEHVEYIREQSEEGHPLCKTILATMYERGLGVPKDVAEAKAIYQAVASTNREAYIELGRMAEEGIGEPVDYAKARQLYELAGARQGNVPSAVRLAKLLEDGKGGPQDLDSALALYVSSLRLYRDEAWIGIRRIRARGLTISAEQGTQYNREWQRAVQRTLARKTRDTQIKLLKTASPGSSTRPIKFQLEFQVGSDVPEVSLLESSGDPAIDKAVISAMSSYRFPDAPILPDDRKSWAVVSGFTLEKRD